MNAYAVIVLVALLSEYLLSITASLLNLRTMSPEVPTEFLGVYEIDRYAKSQEYTHARTRFGLVQESVRLAVLLAFWQLGGFGWLDRAVRAQGWGEIGSGLLFVGGLMAASGLIGLPFQLYSTFFIEEGWHGSGVGWSQQCSCWQHYSLGLPGSCLSLISFRHSTKVFYRKRSSAIRGQ